MAQEINSIIQKVIPILVNSCDIPRHNILADACTVKSTPRRGDLWISEIELTKRQQFERAIYLLIEAKHERIKPLSFDELYEHGTDFELKKEVKQALKQDYNNYSDGKVFESSFKNNGWFDAIIQGKYKATRQGLHFFAVTNCSEICFYHAETLKPIIIKKGKELIPINFWIKRSLLLEISSGITKTNNVLTIQHVETVIDNPSEYEFQKFLRKIHNDNVFRFNEEIIIDSLLTFVFFKFLQEKMQVNNERISPPGCLWNDFVKDAKKGEEGRTIIENMRAQLTLLQDKGSGYKDAYKEFTPILTVPKELRAEENYPVIYEIWKEFSKYYFHGCGFDIYGAIYEEFASTKQKEKLGQYYTRRHISKILAALTLKDVKDVEEGFKVCDPAAGTGGLLTECFNVVYKRVQEKYDGEVSQKKQKLLSEKVFYGYDVVRENVEKAKLNMFFAGDGHTLIDEQDSIKKLPKIVQEDDSQGYDVIVANPPYGNGSAYYKDYVTWMKTKRHELVFVERMIKALKYGGRFGFVVPDGVLENPRFQEFRERLLEQAQIESIISVPVHAFAPYCAQKTYLIIGQRRAFNKIRKLSKDSAFEQEAFDKYTIRKDNLVDMQENIWMYIIDFDGFANSNKRFPTDLTMTNEEGEIEFIHNDLFELKEKYLLGDDGRGNITKINQLGQDGEKLGDVKGGKFYLRKAQLLKLNKDITRKNWYVLLPESYLRKYEPKYISLEDFRAEKKKIEEELKAFVSTL